MAQLAFTNNATLDQARTTRLERPGIRELTTEEIEVISGTGGADIVAEGALAGAGLGYIARGALWGARLGGFAGP